MLEPLEAKALEEKINSILAKLNANLNAGLNGTGFTNACDNVVPSLLANLCRVKHPFVDFHIVSHDMMFIGPVGFLFACVSAGVEYWYQHRYKDDWEAYWSLEIERFDKLNDDLKHLPTALSPASIESLEAIYQSIIWFKNNTKILQELFEIDEAIYAEKLDKIIELNRAVDQVANQLFYRLGSKNINTVVEIADASKFSETFERLQNNYQSENINHKTKTPEKKKEENSWLDGITGIPDTGIFNIVFAYCWNYWGVFFFTLWGHPNAFSVVPLSWGLLALVAPVTYIFYKEYEFYQQESLAILNDQRELNKSIKADRKKPDFNLKIATADARENYRKRYAERRDSISRLRMFGWAFVALVAGCSMGVLLSDFIIGAAVFCAIGMVGWLASRYIDHLHQDQLNQHLPCLSSQDDQNDLSKVESLIPRQKAAFLRRFAQKWMRLKVQEAHWQQNITLQKDLIEKDKSALFKSIDPLPQKDDKRDERSPSKPKNSEVEVKAQTDGRISKVEKARRLIAPFVSFFVGYMLGIIIGFASSDFLCHFFGPLEMGTLANTVVNAVIGVMGLVLGFSFARRANNADEQHRAELDSIRDGLYLKKQAELDALNESILSKRQAISKLMNVVIRQLSAHPNAAAHKKQLDASFEFRRQLLEAQSKPLTSAKILKTLRKGFNVIVNVSSVMLMSRALFVMGFAGIYAFSAGSIALIGLDALSPLAIAVFSVAAVFLVLKSTNEMYLQLQKAKELRAVKYIDIKLESARAEVAYLNSIEEMLNSEFSDLNPTVSEGDINKKLQRIKEPTGFESFWNKISCSDQSNMAVNQPDLNHDNNFNSVLQS